MTANESGSLNSLTLSKAIQDDLKMIIIQVNRIRECHRAHSTGSIGGGVMSGGKFLCVGLDETLQFRSYYGTPVHGIPYLALRY